MSGLIIVSSNFQALLFLQDKLLESVRTLLIPVKEVIKIIGSALYRIDSVSASAQTVKIAIDTESKAKRHNMISELTSFRSTKAKATVNFGVKYLRVYANMKAKYYLPNKYQYESKSDKIVSGN